MCVCEREREREREGGGGGRKGGRERACLCVRASVCVCKNVLAQARVFISRHTQGERAVVHFCLSCSFFG